MSENNFGISELKKVITRSQSLAPKIRASNVILSPWLGRLAVTVNDPKIDFSIIPLPNYPSDTYDAKQHLVQAYYGIGSIFRGPKLTPLAVASETGNPLDFDSYDFVLPGATRRAIRKIDRATFNFQRPGLKPRRRLYWARQRVKWTTKVFGKPRYSSGCGDLG